MNHFSALILAIMCWSVNAQQPPPVRGLVFKNSYSQWMMQLVSFSTAKESLLVTAPNSVYYHSAWMVGTSSARVITVGENFEIWNITTIILNSRKISQTATIPAAWDNHCLDSDSSICHPI